jgi:hypothetical protein
MTGLKNGGSGDIFSPIKVKGGGTKKWLGGALAGRVAGPRTAARFQEDSFASNGTPLWAFHASGKPRF